MAAAAPDFSPERIFALSHWGQLAFVARCALRVLPGGDLTVPEGDSERVVTGRVLSITMMSGFVAVHAAATGRANPRLAGHAAEYLAKQTGDANRCLEIAARLTAAAVGQGLHEPIRRFADLYRSVARKGGVYEAFIGAADADLSELQRYELAPDAAVPAEYFARPLFSPGHGVPTGWEDAVTYWGGVLVLAGLSDVHQFYLSMCVGQPRTAEQAAALVTAFAERELAEPGESAEPATVEAAKAPAAAERAVPPPEPELLLLADRPVEKGGRDLLGFEDYAQSLAVILNDRVATPFTMSINAPWGAGKTSLANLLEERLLNPPGPRLHRQHIILRFNAWMYDDAPNLAAPLVTEVCRRADIERPRWQRFLRPLPAALLAPSARRWRRFGYASLVIVLTLVGLWQVSEHLTHVEGRQKYDAAVNETYQQTTSRTPDGRPIYTDETVTQTRPRTPAPSVPPDLGPADEALKWLQPRLVLLGTFLTAFAGLVGVFVKVLSSTTLLSFVQSPEKAAEGGSIQGAQRTIGRLIKDATATGNRFFVFIDDIERCKPPRAIDVLDAVSQLLDHPNVIVVLLGDMSAVAAAAQVKYKDLAKIYVPAPDLAALSTLQRQEVFGRLYIQKIVQYQFDLPALSRKRIKEYVAQLLEPEDVTTNRDGRPTT
jgi:hypothetical protein